MRPLPRRMPRWRRLRTPRTRCSRRGARRPTWPSPSTRAADSRTWRSATASRTRAASPSASCTTRPQGGSPRSPSFGAIPSSSRVCSTSGRRWAMRLHRGSAGVPGSSSRQPSSGWNDVASPEGGRLRRLAWTRPATWPIYSLAGGAITSAPPLSVPQRRDDSARPRPRVRRARRSPRLGRGDERPARRGQGRLVHAGARRWGARRLAA